jgi:hypothetical protein
MGFELGEGVFDRIEVGTVGRQVKQSGAARFDDIPDTGDLMGRQIVHDDDIAWPRGRRSANVPIPRGTCRDLGYGLSS